MELATPAAARTTAPGGLLTWLDRALTLVIEVPTVLATVAEVFLLLV
jgi:hypothetical protein